MTIHFAPALVPLNAQRSTTLRTLRRQAEQAVAEASRRLQVATKGMKRQREIELRQARTAALKVGRSAR